jgi:hypothetical protein
MFNKTSRHGLSSQEWADHLASIEGFKGNGTYKEVRKKGETALEQMDVKWLEKNYLAGDLIGGMARMPSGDYVSVCKLYHSSRHGWLLRCKIMTAQEANDHNALLDDISMICQK